MPDGALGCVGQKQERAERKKVLALAQARKVEVILVTELTPWGRSARFAARSLTCFKFRFVSSPPTGESIKNRVLKLFFGSVPGVNDRQPRITLL